MKRKKRTYFAIVSAALLCITALIVFSAMIIHSKNIDNNTDYVRQRYEVITSGINKEFSNSISVRRDYYSGSPGSVKYDVLLPITSDEEFLEKTFAMYVVGEQLISETDSNYISADSNSIGFYCGDYQVEYYKRADEVLIESDIPDVEKKITEIRDELKEYNPEYSYPIKISKLSSDG